MIKLAIFFSIYLCAKSQDYYDEKNEWINNYAVDRIAEDLERSLEFVDTRRMQGEAGYGSTIAYDMEIVVRDGDALKLCDVKLLANVYLQTYDLVYYNCDKQDLEERDDVPIDDVEETDDSSYNDCESSDLENILHEIIKRMNEQVDEMNDGLDYPEMMRMDDLKQQHYDHPKLDNCKKASRGPETVYKATVSARQDGIPQRCEIEMIVNGDEISMNKSQCQGQN